MGEKGAGKVSPLSGCELNLERTGKNLLEGDVVAGVGGTSQAELSWGGSTQTLSF